MRYYLGVVCLLLGIWLIYKAIDHRKRVIAARERMQTKGKVLGDPALGSMGVAMLPFYVLYGAIASLLLIGGFFLSDLSQYLSILDLAGLIVLVIGHSVFITMRTAYPRLGLDLSNSQ
ncbi:MAG TPA: hypothetical protein DDY14_02565 [Chromatiaceae bacterium]|jgi:hypothetical protein|nr:MAG: hypothetical protein N838_27105 [Thiohalocapsa sp. PB-PSB1]HBG94210.1 hypothetical protein [Chromatiaceae bacterium]HCS88656.1 hypothetical protein [Chromatiaceae bacterium]